MPATLSMSLPPLGPVPVRTSLRTSRCSTNQGALGDEAAERESEDVDLVQPEGPDVEVARHRLDAVGYLPGGRADPRVVEGDDVPVLRDRVDG